MVSFLVDKLIKYGIDILVKLILKWVEDQQKKEPKTIQSNQPETVALKSGWADK